MMSPNGIKRKLSDREDIASSDPAPHGLGGNCSLRQSLLNMSLDKFNTGRMMVEPSLRRSVLIANTLRVLQGEMRQENSRTPSVADLTEPATEGALPAAQGTIAPYHLTMHNHPPGLAQDLDTMFFSEDDFSLTSAISSILKDLEVVLEDGAPAQNHSRISGNHETERKQEVSTSKYYSQSPLPSISYCDESRLVELKRVLTFDSCHPQAPSQDLAGSVEDMDIELVGELILGAEVCQGHPWDIVESLSPKPDHAPLPLLQKDSMSRMPESKPLDSIFGNFELMSSSYLKDLPLDDLFLDIDTSVFEREPSLTQGAFAGSRAPVYSADDLPTSASSCNSASFTSSQVGRDLNELDNIMEILVDS